MSKLVISSILIIALIFSIPFITVNPVKAVEVGDRIAYSINAASASYSYTANGSTQSGSTNKFSIADAILDVDDEFNITVKTKSSSLIEFEVTKDGTSIGNTSSGSFEFGISLLVSSIFPFIAMGLMSGSFEPDFTDGVCLGDWIFLAPTGIDWDEMNSIYNNQTYWEDVSGILPEEFALNGSSNWLDDGDAINFIFEAKGSYVNTTEDIDLVIDHIMRFDYNTVGRNLLGFKINTDISGTLEGASASYKTNVEIVKKGYSMGSAEIPGFENIFAILSLGILAPLVRRRRK